MILGAEPTTGEQIGLRPDPGIIKECAACNGALAPEVPILLNHPQLSPCVRQRGSLMLHAVLWIGQ